MKWRQCLALSAVFAALTALGLLVFPGHSFLLSDTQIYIPLFEHLRDSRLLNSDLILSGAHLSSWASPDARLEPGAPLNATLQRGSVNVGQRPFSDGSSSNLSN